MSSSVHRQLHRLCAESGNQPVHDQGLDSGSTALLECSSVSMRAPGYHHCSLSVVLGCGQLLLSCPGLESVDVGAIVHSAKTYRAACSCNTDARCSSRLRRNDPRCRTCSRHDATATTSCFRLLVAASDRVSNDRVEQARSPSARMWSHAIHITSCLDAQMHILCALSLGAVLEHCARSTSTSPAHLYAPLSHARTLTAE